MSLRINTYFGWIKSPKTSNLTSYNYVYWKKKGILRLGLGKSILVISKSSDSSLRLWSCLPKELVQSHVAILVPRPLLIFVVGNWAWRFFKTCFQNITVIYLMHACSFQEITVFQPLCSIWRNNKYTMITQKGNNFILSKNFSNSFPFIKTLWKSSKMSVKSELFIETAMILVIHAKVWMF